MCDVHRPEPVEPFFCSIELKDKQRTSKKRITIEREKKTNRKQNTPVWQSLFFYPIPLFNLIKIYNHRRIKFIQLNDIQSDLSPPIASSVLCDENPLWNCISSSIWCVCALYFCPFPFRFVVRTIQFFQMILHNCVTVICLLNPLWQTSNYTYI